MSTLHNGVTSMITPPPPHHWFTPAQCAAMLDARQHGSSWRARCPVHGGDNPDSLHIWEDVDAYGYPRTALYCHAHQCSRSDLCAVMGIEVRDLYSTPANTCTTSRLPRGKSPRIAKLEQMDDPTPD